MKHIILIIFAIFNWPSITYGQNTLNERDFRVVNDTDLSFDLQPQAFQGAYYTAFPLELRPSSEILFSLKSYDPIQTANGIMIFMLSGRYVFSLVIKEQMVSIHGCKSKNVFYHPEDYVCSISTFQGRKSLNISRLSNAKK